MEERISPALKYLSKICAILSVLIVIYPFVFLVQNAGSFSNYAITTTHVHLAGNTLLFFMVGFFFTFTSYKKAKIVWPLISAVALLFAMSGIFFETQSLIIPGYSIFALSLLVMAVGILHKIN